MKRLPYLSVAITSAAALAYEILLMKLFGIIQWHHFAYMIISLALLGYGASGTFLSLAREWLLKHFAYAYIANIMLFSVASFVSFSIAQQIPFNPLELLWERAQLLWLFEIYLLLALPFFFAANAIGLAFIRHRTDISGLYGADLLGAGLGSLGILILLYLFFPESILQLIAFSGLLGTAIAIREMALRANAAILLLFAAALFTIFFFGREFTLKMNTYKDLSQTLLISGTEIVEERSSALGRISVVKSPEIPFRHAPGLSMAYAAEPPEQLALFSDGDSMSVITRFPDAQKHLGYLDYQTSALAYHLDDIDNVLIIGAGGGADILQALYHGTEKIDAVEIDSRMVDLVATTYSGFSGGLYTRDNVTVHTAEARGFIASSSTKFDLIQMAMVESFGASSAGLQSLNENYLYTIEALQLYLSRLKPGGYLSVTRWLKLPPRDMLKLFATVVEALKMNGVAHPEKQILVIRGLQTGTLVVKNGSFGIKEIAQLRDFCDTRFFDTVYYYGMPASEANRYNKLAEPLFFEGVNAILEDKAQFFRNYKFDIRPPTDDRPYFYHFFKWKTLPELFALRGSGGLHLLEWGYLVLVAALLQAIVAAAVLILLPLLVQKSKIGTSRTKVLFYFFALGLGFLFLEIYFIQRFTLFLSHPLSTVAVVLSSFLIFAGLGSAYSRKLAKHKGYRSGTRYAIVTIFILGFFYMMTLDQLFAALISQGEFVKAAITAALIAPMAFAMGIPFPMGLSELGEHTEDLIPWAWGINGCASVISAIAATLVAIHFGFAVVMVLALIFYLVAFLFFPVPKGLR